ncbi:MAG: PEP-CTERM sorting domain-containing protein [Azoarcus sp.]|nr:PEP-CTERM sorting domain-containing protein [Azoarcus sp.]
MMKPLLTAATCVLSFAALLGSVPASAQAITVDGVWNDSGNLFFDLPGFGYAFLTLPVGDNGLYRFNTRQNAPQSQAPDYDQFFYIRNNQATNIDGNNSRDFTQDKVVGHIGNNTDIGKIMSFTEFYNDADDLYKYQYHENLTQMIDGVGHSWGGYTSYDDPAFVISELSTAYAALPYSGIGVFDFEQSFMYYSDGSSISLADYMRQSFNAPLTGAGDYQSLSFNTRDKNNFSFNWLDDKEVAGMALAYNPVPEPETWVMLLTGLGIVAAGARRQRKQQCNRVGLG